MKLTPFEEQKKQFDTKLALYFANRVFTDLKNTDAYKQGIIDGVGNVLKSAEGKNAWAFTPFDKLVLALKQHLGEAELKSLLAPFEGTAETDPLRLMQMQSTDNLQKIRAVIGKVVSALEGVVYLPADSKYSEEYLGDSDKCFNDRASLAFTQASFLLFALIHDKTPGLTDFEFNVIPATELTFNITALTDYKKVFTPLKEAGLIDDRKITNTGIRLLVRIAEQVYEGNILVQNRDRIENQSHVWSKLAKGRG